jgi:hypothetical protein
VLINIQERIVPTEIPALRNFVTVAVKRQQYGTAVSQASMLYVTVKKGSKTELPVSWKARLRLQKQEQTN